MPLLRPAAGPASAAAPLIPTAPCPRRLLLPSLEALDQARALLVLYHLHLSTPAFPTLTHPEKFARCCAENVGRDFKLTREAQRPSHPAWRHMAELRPTEPGELPPHFQVSRPAGCLGGARRLCSSAQGCSGCGGAGEALPRGRSALPRSAAGCRLQVWDGDSEVKVRLGRALREGSVPVAALGPMHLARLGLLPREVVMEQVLAKVGGRWQAGIAGGGRALVPPAQGLRWQAGAPWALLAAGACSAGGAIASLLLPAALPAHPQPRSSCHRG